MLNSTVRQGDYLPEVRHIYAGSTAGPVPHPTHLGVVVLSQCCDLAKMSASNLPVCAAVVRLEGSEAALAKSGRQPRFASAEHFGAGFFVDFGIVGSLEPDLVTEVIAETDLERRRTLAGRIARRFSRFAYPDEVQPFLGSLQKLLRSRVTKDSPVAPIGDELPKTTLLRVVPQGLDRTAELIGACAAEDRDLLPLWQRFAELLCEGALSAAVPAVVSDWAAEVTDESDFSYSRFVRSADLDVDDLSETERSETTTG